MSSRFSQWRRALKEIKGVQWWWDEPMARRTSFRIGGRVRCLALARSEEAFAELVRMAHRWEIPHVILGAASNVLMPDGLWDVLVIQARDFGAVPAANAGNDAQPMFHFAAGVNLAALQRFCLNRGLRGIEPLAGIPGTVGGALVMNAGSGSGTIADVLVTIDVLDQRRERRRLSIGELNPGYRSLGLPARWVVVGAQLRFRKGSKDALRTAMRENLDYRRRTQPLGRPSAGSVFKNPPGRSAGELIERAGLKGLTRGDAQISTVHANWIVNLGRARAADVIALIETMEERVEQQFGVILEREIKVLGDHG